MIEPARPDGFLARGGAWVVVQFTFLLAVLLGAVLWRAGWVPLWMSALGAVLFLAGGWFGVGGARVLGKSRTPFPRPRPEATLVRHGIYARVRHPLYTSVMLLSLGWALIWQSWPAAAVALAQIPFFCAKARREERWLREKFPDYAGYAKRVPIFLPRLRPGTRQPE